MPRRLIFALLCVCAAEAQIASRWRLVWSDEFNQPAGTAPDPEKWNYDLGGGGWGNGEVEVYTSSRRNVLQDGKGNLIIRAMRDSEGNYTSAQLQTGSPGAWTHATNFSWQYGRIVARIKLPFGRSVWPAFWMLGENIGAVGWPACGKIDIKANFGTFNNSAAVINGASRGPGYSGGNASGKSSASARAEGRRRLPRVLNRNGPPTPVEWFVDGASSP